MHLNLTTYLGTHSLRFDLCYMNRLIERRVLGISTKKVICSFPDGLLKLFGLTAMAGNIIPAIATTNAIIAGMLVMEGIKVLDGRIEDCRSVYLNRLPNPRGRILVPCRLEKPIPKCYVCSAKNEVNVMLNTQTTTLATLNDKILKATFNMVAPDVRGRWW